MKREAILWSMALLLLATVMIASVWNVPELSPAAATVQSAASTEETTAATTAAETELTAQINLNTATEAQLMEISGIGPTLAARIVAWRELHGGFDRLDQLLDIDGIGEKRLAQWSPYLTLSDPAEPTTSSPTDQP